MEIFLTSQTEKVIDQIIPLLDRKPAAMKLAFIPTAGDPYGGNKPWLDADRAKLVELGFLVKDFSLKGKIEAETKKALSDADIIFVAGGNTFYLLD